MEEEDKQIDRFLSGTMTPAENDDLVRRMEADDELRRKVELQQALGQYLGGEELELVELLKETEAKTTEQKPRRTRWWWLLLGLIPIITFFLWKNARMEVSPINMQDESHSPPLQPTDSFEVQSPEINTPDLPLDTAPVPSPAPAAPPPPVKQPEKQQQPVQETVNEPPPQVYAGLDPELFTPNPILEGLVGGQLRNETQEVAIKAPRLNDTIRKVPIIFTFSLPEEKTVELVVYSNNPSDFELDKPVFRQVISAATDQKAPQVTVPNLPEAGLYYLLLLDDEEEFLLGERLLYSYRK